MPSLRRLMMLLVASVLTFWAVDGVKAAAQAASEAETEEADEAPAASASEPAEEKSAAEKPEEPAPVAEAAPAAEAPVPVAEAPAPQAEVSTDGSAHAIQKGDTLWDLAERYYKDPYKWGRIWDANKDAIRNPNLIFPDQRLTIPGVESAAAEAPAATAEAPAAEEPAAEAPAAPVETVAAPPAPPAVPEVTDPAAPPAPPEAVPAEVAAPVEEAAAPTEAPAEAPVAEPEPALPPEPAPKKKSAARYVPTDLGGDNYVVDENWEADGYVLRDEQKKLMISQDDVVYLNIGASNGAKAYMRGGIYRRGGKIKDPDSRENLGFIMRRIGTFQLTENVNDGSATAVVTSSKEPIRIGDIVRLENR